MGRSGYDDNFGEDDPWRLIRYRGAVASAIRGKRGQAFLREMLQALDALPEKKLISGELEQDGQVCAIGAVGKVRGVDMSGIDSNDPFQIADTFGINEKMVREITYENDEAWFGNVTPERRFYLVREWVVKHIKEVDENGNEKQSG